MLRFLPFVMFCMVLSCKNHEPLNSSLQPEFQFPNLLDYTISPKGKFDKNGLMFSDQGAWFAFGFPDTTNTFGGFSGPFLMTQQNGIWSSPSLVKLDIRVRELPVEFEVQCRQAFSSHLEQEFRGDSINLKQELVYKSGHTALIRSTLVNSASEPIEISLRYSGAKILADSLLLKSNEDELIIESGLTDAVGHITFPEAFNPVITGDSYQTNYQSFRLRTDESITFVHTISFIFKEYSWEKELSSLNSISFEEVLAFRSEEKNEEMESVIKSVKKQFDSTPYKKVIGKAHLTLQNNWRIPAGEIKHEGLFPSYHYKWFNGFWSWDSWKHAVGLSFYNTDLAKKQMKLMFEFQRDDGFIVDCVYRDTTIEPHNFRDTKPPLSAWAVVRIFNQDQDLEFVKFMYPKLKKYHNWWYDQRDHDRDGLCEYGSTDGSLIAAKWESGMDNAIRFDHATILNNKEGAYSLNQESVDLNAYLFAEKQYLAMLAKALEKDSDANRFEIEAEELKERIQLQFFDPADGWFYDTSLDGSTFIKGAGSEGWTALWAKAATVEQAMVVKDKMMNPAKFFTRVPFQTMSADHPKFDPSNGYWRGPNWLDQSYFGIQGLRNYGFHTEADNATVNLIAGAEGLLIDGISIRENYHPLSGKGLYAKNFSWSAAHLIMMLCEPQ